MLTHAERAVELEAAVENLVDSDGDNQRDRLIDEVSKSSGTDLLRSLAYLTSGHMENATNCLPRSKEQVKEITASLDPTAAAPFQE